MTSDEATAIFCRALDAAGRNSDAYQPGHANPQTFLAEHLMQLRAAAVPAVATLVRPDESARRFGNWQDRPYAMFIVARSGSEALLLDPNTQLFSLASLDPTGELRLVGFASPDPLSEWVS